MKLVFLYNMISCFISIHPLYSMCIYMTVLLCRVRKNFAFVKRGFLKHAERRLVYKPI